ncbi:MAG: rod shape-determining protein RodA [Candidatus Goldiibacteriota bacterium HGW-Goldbacteria-1]|jgi:rod shape determining protein RodA|nr:MAG: rod shape-determining protein RodA [Candidatus Goldiibacteriota bacterium HGW-Goldbacteria-1]
MRKFRGIFKLTEQLRQYTKNMNPVMLGATILLMGIGLLGIYSAEPDAGKVFFSKQSVWYGIGFILMIIIANINYNLVIAAANHLFVIFIFLLILVLIVGHTSLGAQRWLKIAGHGFQPSEFMKLVVAATVVRFLVIKGKEAFSFKNLALVFVIVFIPFFLILKQPDLGSALMLIPMTLAILFLGNIPIKKLSVILIIGVLILPVAYYTLHDYQKQRLHTFVNPHLDPLGSGYNVIQSQIAVGSGEVLGKGWGKGTQSQLNFIPIKHTDFIFAVLAEEFGLWGGLIIIGIYLFLIMEALKIIKLCRFTGGKMLGGALVTMIFAQFFVNVGMNMGIMPVAGITLPLLSYGGTSVIVTMTALGMLQNIYREYIKAEE